MSDHLTVFPNGLAIDIYDRAAGISSLAFCIEFKQLRAGHIFLLLVIILMASLCNLDTISFDPINGIDPSKVEDIFVSSHIPIVDIQETFALRVGRIDCTVLKINGFIIAGVPVTINIYGLTGRIERTVFERTALAGIGPQGITHNRDARCLCTGGVEGNVFKRSRFIAPVVGTAIENTIFQCEIMDTHKPLCIVSFPSSVRIHTTDNSHILKSNTIAAVKAIVAPTIRPVCFLRGTNLPRCFSGTGAHKGQTFPRSIAACRRVLSVAAVGSLAKIDGVSVFRIRHGFVKRTITAFSANFGHSIRHNYCCGRIFRQSHDRHHADQHDQCQQTG